jgi:hypothetical protein
MIRTTRKTSRTTPTTRMTRMTSRLADSQNSRPRYQPGLACVEKRVFGAASKFVPTKTLRRRNHLPWMNSTILHYIKKKNSIRTRIKRSRHQSEHLKQKISRASHYTIKRMLRTWSCLDYINSVCASREHNPKRFWSFFKIKSKVSNVPLKVSVKSSENQNQRTYSNNNIHIANNFNEYDNNSDHNPGEHWILITD